MSDIFLIDRRIAATELKSCLKGKYQKIGRFRDYFFDNFTNLSAANDSSLVFFIGSSAESKSFLFATRASTVILDIKIFEDLKKCKEIKKINKLLLFCNSPRTNFSLIVKKFFDIDIKNKQVKRVHPTAVISTSADIASDVTIGAYSVIGDVKVDKGTIIGSHVIIEDNVRIGKNVKIGSSSIIGSSAFAEILNEEDADGIDFPQLGGVQIGDDVQIGTKCIIQRGALNDTLIEEGAVIDNNVVIAHNVHVGERAVIIGSSHIAGSVDIGKRAFIGQSVTVANVGTIGSNAFVGLGSVVTQAVGMGEKVFGNPAKKIITPKK